MQKNIKPPEMVLALGLLPKMILPEHYPHVTTKTVLKYSFTKEKRKTQEGSRLVNVPD